jgi:hypothetical protein
MSSSSSSPDLRWPTGYGRPVQAATDGRRASSFALGLRARSVRGLSWMGAAICAACGSYDVPLGSVTTYALPAVTCGTWDSLGAHTVGGYFVGHTTSSPDDISYFVFDLTAVQGRTVTHASLTIPGTSDWKITVSAPETPPLQFKLGATPLPASVTMTQVMGGSDDPDVYSDVHAEQDLGFGWVSSGAATTTYGAFTYDTGRLQDAVNAGGPYAMFAVERFGETAGTDEYLYGGGVCGPDIVLNVTVE